MYNVALYYTVIQRLPALSCRQLGSAILEAVEQNTLSVEPVGFQPLPVVKASAVECGGPK